LSAVGATTERLLPEIETPGYTAGRPVDGVTSSPAYYTFSAVAQGFAATLGDGTLTAEHVVLATLWAHNSHSLAVLEALDVTRESIVDQLRSLGVCRSSRSAPPACLRRLGRPGVV
jgi:hypothetical protein